jgi:hypothetical protein
MSATPGSARGRAEDREAAKVRRQKIFIGIGGGILLLVMAFELLPALFGSSSGSASGSDTTAAASATPAVPVAPSGSASTTSLLSHAVAHLKTRDLFKPQLSTSGVGGVAAGAASLAATTKGPSVRAKNFVAKDLFIPQVKVASATPASTPVEQAGGTESSSAGSSSKGSAGYIVVVASIPGINGASQKAAARALVAARNAGLKDVVANDAVPGTSGSAPHFTIYTGPYQFVSTVQSELKRALTNGYPHAHAQKLPSTSGKGF